MVLVVFPAGLLVAGLLWRKQQGLLGNLAGVYLLVWRCSWEMRRVF